MNQKDYSKMKKDFARQERESNNSRIQNAAKVLDLAKRTRHTNLDVCLKSMRLYHSIMNDVKSKNIWE